MGEGALLDGGEWSTLRPGHFSPGREPRYPLNRRLLEVQAIHFQFSWFITRRYTTTKICGNELQYCAKYDRSTAGFWSSPVQHGWVLPVISLQIIIHSEVASPYCLPVSGIRKQYTESVWDETYRKYNNAKLPCTHTYIYIYRTLRVLPNVWKVKFSLSPPGMHTGGVEA